MRGTTGRVVDGKIDVGDALEEGTAVAVLADAAREGMLTDADEQELADALEAIRRGEYVDGRELLRELKGSSGR